MDKDFVAGAVLKDLSKSFDGLNHEVLIAILNGYGYSTFALHIIHSYLTDGKERLKVNCSFSTCTETLLGAPQGSGFGYPLFDIYFNNHLMYLEDTEICNYADYKTIDACGSQIEKFYGAFRE